MTEAEPVSRQYVF